MNQTPVISIILIDGSFRESFHALDFFGRQTFPHEQYELIWVEYYDKVDPRLAAKAAQYPNFQIITLGRTGLYHSAYCRNAGVRASRGELIVYADGDVVVEEDFLQLIWNEHQKTDDLVIFLYRRDEPRAAHRADWDLAHLQAAGRIQHTQNYGACFSVRRQWLVEINGWEQHVVFASHFNYHGLDIYTRFKNLGLAVKWHPGIRLYHPWHPQTSTLTTFTRLQEAFSAYRAQNLVTTAYDGLDVQRNSPAPPELELQIAALRRQLALKERGPLGEICYYIGMVWGKVRRRLDAKAGRSPKAATT
jgi:glycosyltransferase involved in cell wall biosynthesis